MEEMRVRSKDEIGTLTDSVNKMVKNIRILISGISGSAVEISASSEELSATIEEISCAMETVNESVNQISKGAQDLSATTEEVGASAEEIGSTTYELTRRADDANSSSNEIKLRAKGIKEKSAKSAETSMTIYKEKQKSIVKAIEEGKIVEEVKVMADSIANIASQTNLLALHLCNIDCHIFILKAILTLRWFLAILHGKLYQTLPQVCFLGLYLLLGR